MRSVLIAIIAPVLLATSAMAGYNCKCQDNSGQYNSYSQLCCSRDPWWGTGTSFHADQHNQCSNPSNGLDSGAFANCCRGLGVSSDPYGGAYCWQ